MDTRPDVRTAFAHRSLRVALWIVAGLVPLATAGCGRWVPAAPVRVAPVSPDDAYAEAIRAARATGYLVEEADAEQKFFRVRAKLDDDVKYHSAFSASLRRSFFSCQVDPEQVLHITASGYHVRDNEMHVKLREEMDHFSRAIVAALKATNPDAQVVNNLHVERTEPDERAAGSDQATLQEQLDELKRRYYAKEIGNEEYHRRRRALLKKGK